MRLSKKAKSTLVSAALIAVAALVTYFAMGQDGSNRPAVPAEPLQPGSGGVTVQYLDVGQADAGLVLLPGGKTMLIDAGKNASADQLVQYLKDQGIQKIDYLIGTHPHEDHIGGLDAVIDAFEIGAIYLPRIPDGEAPTTKTYEDVLTAIDKKNLKVTAGKGGTAIFEVNGCSAEILAPNSDSYPEMNSYSIVVMLTCGEKKFLFMGDAETDSEEEILDRYKVKADVLKCGHHGSSTSTSRDFFEEVQPSYAVISCGRDNTYGHPHQETMKLLEKNKVTVYRTDEDHTVIAVCDGKAISFSTAQTSLAP